MGQKQTFRRNKQIISGWFTQILFRGSLCSGSVRKPGLTILTSTKECRFLCDHYEIGWAHRTGSEVAYQFL